VGKQAGDVRLIFDDGDSPCASRRMRLEDHVEKIIQKRDVEVTIT